MTDLKVTNLYGGGHEIISQSTGQDVVLVRVRPVGTLEMGDLCDFFVTDWVPELVEALKLARLIADRKKPWEPWPTLKGMWALPDA